MRPGTDGVDPFFLNRFRPADRRIVMVQQLQEQQWTATNPWWCMPRVLAMVWNSTNDELSFVVMKQPDLDSDANQLLKNQHQIVPGKSASDPTT